MVIKFIIKEEAFFYQIYNIDSGSIIGLYFLYDNNFYYIVGKINKCILKKQVSQKMCQSIINLCMFKRLRNLPEIPTKEGLIRVSIILKNITLRFL